MTLPSVSFAGLVERHRAELLAYITRLLGNREHAEDICQETFLRAYRSFSRLTTHQHLRAWLFKIATHAAFNHSRNHRRARRLRVDRDPDTLPASSRTERETQEPMREVARAVQNLPQKQRTALVLRIFQDQSYETIARILGSSSGAARANVYQALEKLRRKFH